MLRPYSLGNPYLDRRKAVSSGVSSSAGLGSADVFRLAGFLGDNNLIHHEAPFEDWIRERRPERIVNRTTSQGAIWIGQSSEGKAGQSAGVLNLSSSSG
jgi:hypothetical protein